MFAVVVIVVGQLSALLISQSKRQLRHNYKIIMSHKRHLWQLERRGQERIALRFDNRWANKRRRHAWMAGVAGMRPQSWNGPQDSAGIRERDTDQSAVAFLTHAACNSGATTALATCHQVSMEKTQLNLLFAQGATPPQLAPLQFPFSHSLTSSFSTPPVLFVSLCSLLAVNIFMLKTYLFAFYA